MVSIFLHNTVSPNAVGDTPTVKSIKSGKIDPIVGEYSMDYFTVPSNVSGTPAICFPIYPKNINLNWRDNPPVMYKLWGKYGKDLHLLRISQLINKAISDLYFV